jgi:4-deoxy-L-threo-5-hexosulose-uronate ketol-isomerase
METRYVPDFERYRRMTAAELRDGYLVEGLFEPDAIRLVYADIDRVVLGTAVPQSRALALGTDKELAAGYFTERREIGVMNIGGQGTVIAGSETFKLAARDCLYIGRGTRSVEFRSEDPRDPARFYLVSYPAHATHPTRMAARADVEAVALGSPADANQRTIRKYIHPGGIHSCQLVMGCTDLKEGSVWNTMPPHTHARRTEVYLYFDVAAEATVFHLMGTASETRHIAVRNGEAVLSPPWSIHSGVGTRHYSFIWAMGGENQEFADMDGISVRDMK